jgi:hypothetical protein
MTRSAPLLHRFGTVLLVLLLTLLGAPNARADTSSQTSVTFDIVDQGRLDIAWAPDVPAFTVSGEAPVLTATSPPVEAIANFQLHISDTRADGNRTGYAITIQSTAFTPTRSGATIQPGQLHISAITTEPAGIRLNSAATAATLDRQITILTVESGAAAVNATVTISVALLLMPGMVATSYSGSLWFDVLPLSSGI